VILDRYTDSSHEEEHEYSNHHYISDAIREMSQINSMLSILFSPKSLFEGFVFILDIDWAVFEIPGRYKCHSLR
jgi:hypothetical protein